MTAEQRNRVQALVRAALAQDPSGSTVPEFLPDDDEEVRDEVHRLLTGYRGDDTQSIEIDAEVLRAGDFIAGRYRIVRRLGSGGMGAVYEAHDEELGGSVALKTILSHLVASPEALARFRNEVALARQVTHPNVCRVFDVGRHADAARGRTVAFLTMEYVSGEPLKLRLQHKGRFSLDEALSILRQVIAGLAAVHARDIVHRDLKPHNIMLTPQPDGERAVLMDFGLARPNSVAAIAGAGLTRTGAIPGTPRYLAPELFYGEEASVASDLYALGMLMYEMAAGAGPAGFDRLTEEAPPPCTAAPDIDPRWEAAIMRCLRRNPRERFAGTAELLGALEAPPRPAAPRRLWLRLSVCAALVLLIAIFAGRDRIARWLTRVPQQRHVAVLPFTTYGSEIDRQLFAEGLTETITAKLSQLEQFQDTLWVAPSSELRTRGVRSVAETRKAFNITLAVAGNVQQSGSSVRITANLVDARTLKQLDSRTIDVAERDLMTLQNRVIGAVVEMLQLEVQPRARRVLAAGQTSDPAAYQMYEEGMGFIRRAGQENLSRAVSLFQKAVERDANYALAYARLAEAFWRRYYYSSSLADLELARSNSERAMELNSELAPVHATLGMIYSGTGQPEAALRAFDRALQLDPKNGDALTSLATLYSRLGRYGDAEQTYKRAIRLRPNYWGGYNMLGGFYFLHSRYEEALKMYRIVGELIPEDYMGPQNAGSVLLALGRYDEAEKSLRRAIAVHPTARAYSALGACAILQSRPRDAVDLLRKAIELDAKNNSTWRNLGDAYMLIPGMQARAREAYRNALALVDERLKVDGKNTGYLLDSALYHGKLGNKRQALEIAARVQPNALTAAEWFKTAVVLEVAGDRTRALEALRRAVHARYSAEQIRKEPELAALRRDPRAAALLSAAK